MTLFNCSICNNKNVLFFFQGSIFSLILKIIFFLFDDLSTPYFRNLTSLEVAIKFLMLQYCPLVECNQLIELASSSRNVQHFRNLECFGSFLYKQRGGKSKAFVIFFLLFQYTIGLLLFYIKFQSYLQDASFQTLHSLLLQHKRHYVYIFYIFYPRG